MITKTTEIKCRCCGKVFWSEYYHGGSNEHDGYTSDHNMGVHISRLKDKDENLGKFFLGSIMLDGNFCNIKDHTYKVALEVFDCRIKWLEKNGHGDIAKYLESRRDDIRQEFEKIKALKIEELQIEIDKIKNAGI